MADWILTYQKGVQNGARGLRAEEWQRFESEVPEHPPTDMKALYSAFNGGELEGGVKLYSFDKVLEAREHSEDSTWVFGEKGNQRLLSSRKATLASHPGLALRPTWFETTHADDLVFAVHDARAGTVRVYPSLEQLLAVLVPPAQLEAFGDHTYARAMAAVESVISDVAGKAKKAAEKVTQLATKKTAKTPAAKPSAKGAKKPAAKNSAVKSAKKPAAKKSAVKRAKKPAAKPGAKGAKKPAAKKSPAKKQKAGKNAARRR
jgi:hypothetical protein